MRMLHQPCVALLFLLLLQVQHESSASLQEEEEFDYCIVGAGPAGVQLGHFLKHAGRRYVIFEYNNQAGSFFQKYPRHRRLISLNKRFVREGRAGDFALRHDWNSLLDVRPEGERTRPMTERSQDLFPHADVLAEYLAEFAQEQLDSIRYGVAVERIAWDNVTARFTLQLESKHREAEKAPAQCRQLVLATGFTRPRGAKVRVDGARYVEGYESLPETGESYAGKSVIILGLGNAALETSQELQKHAAETHVYGRGRPLPEGGRGPRFAYQTHYVGDIRAGRTTILDTYLLKSLDTFDFTALEGTMRLVVIPCNGTRYCVWGVQSDDCADDRCQRLYKNGGQDLNYWLPVGSWLLGGRTGERVRELLAANGLNPAGPGGLSVGWRIKQIDVPKTMEGPELDEEETELVSKGRLELGIQDEVFDIQLEELDVTSALLNKMPRLRDALAEMRTRLSSDSIRYPIDHIIRCFGWAFDHEVFDKSVPVNTTHTGKYPQITPGYEVVGVPGLYVAGTLTHSLDFRKSAGGFIHGFRYTARALFRLLEEKNHGVPWPHSIIPLGSEGGGAAPSCGVDQLVAALHRRINEASGPYQMFQSLGDMVIFENDTEAGHWWARYLEEVPLQHFEERFLALPRLQWVFRYGEAFHGPKVLGFDRVGTTNPRFAELSNFLHPQLLFFPPGAREPSMRHWLVEDIFTQWHGTTNYASLAGFVARVAANATGDPSLAMEGSYQLEPPWDEEEACYASKGPTGRVAGDTTVL